MFFRLFQSNVKILTFVLLVGYSVPVIISCLLSGIYVIVLAEESNTDATFVSKTTQWEKINSDEVTGITEMVADELVKGFIQ